MCERASVIPLQVSLLPNLVGLGQPDQELLVDVLGTGQPEGVDVVARRDGFDARDQRGDSSCLAKTICPSIHRRLSVTAAKLMRVFSGLTITGPNSWMTASSFR